MEQPAGSSLLTSGMVENKRRAPKSGAVAAGALRSALEGADTGAVGLEKPAAMDATRAWQQLNDISEGDN